MGRENPRFTECFLRTEAQYPIGCLLSQDFHAGRLPVCGDESLQFFPQLIHSVQLGPLFGEPYQLDTEFFG